MRLSSLQQQTVVRLVKETAGDGARVWLFGSRLEDHARGGDVDLLLETPRPLAWLDRARLRMQLEQHLMLPVDLVIRQQQEPWTPFQRIAREKALEL